MSVLIVCFDGTDNEPEDARTIVEDGAARDVSITNVVKLHLMAGGDLRGRVDTAHGRMQTRRLSISTESARGVRSSGG